MLKLTAELPKQTRMFADKSLNGRMEMEKHESDELADDKEGEEKLQSADRSLLSKLNGQK